MLKFLANEGLRVAREYVFINVQKNYYNKKEVLDFLGEFSNSIAELIIWNKCNPMPASGHNITNGYEFVIALTKTGKPLKARKSYTKNIITTPVNSNNVYKKIHKAVMNEDFAKEFFSKFIEPNKRVLDPFSGLATTGIACMNNDDDYVGIEIVPKYADLSRKRLKEKGNEIALF
jgi:site-specific DNA-methyltransferase (cytosine-N4-specific)